MPTPEFEPYSPGMYDDTEKKIKGLMNAYVDTTQYLGHLLSFLDSDNVKKLNTNKTSIRSNNGETEIDGPLLIMKDKQETPVIRLKMGYDIDSLDFVYQLMNAVGDVTVNIDSGGNLTVERGTFKGSITIGTNNNVFKADGATGIWLGHTDFASAPFKVGLDGAATATNLAITGGSISVDTDLLVGNNIFLGDMADTSKNIYFFNDGISEVAYIGFDADSLMQLHNTSGSIELLTPYNIELDSANQVSIHAPQLIIQGNSGGLMQLTKSGSENMYFYHGGGGHLWLAHGGSGDLWLLQDGTGVLKIEAKNNMSIESINGVVYAEGKWRYSTKPYYGDDTALNTFTTLSDVQNELNGYATESWVTSNFQTTISGASGSFTTADGKTVTVSNGIVTSIV
ncbi:MAG: hypothetical protein ABFD25_03315 [Clostridiaceae bacterium]